MPRDLGAQLGAFRHQILVAQREEEQPANMILGSYDDVGTREPQVGLPAICLGLSVVSVS